MSTDPEYFLRLAAAFVRGRLMRDSPNAIDNALLACRFDNLSADQMQVLIRVGQEHDLRLHKFKRIMDLPRVCMALDILKGLQPRSLLDIGSGRGAFLWPLLDAFPELPVTCVDILEQRVQDIEAVSRGGVQNVSAFKGDVTALEFPDRHFDVVTMLEVLEHIPDTAQALKEVCRVAQRALVLSVPSRADDNPEHIHLFDQRTLVEKLRHIVSSGSVPAICLATWCWSPQSHDRSTL